MINRLIEFSLKNRFLVLLAYAMLAGWGYWALIRTPIDAIPDLSENQVIIFTDWPGRSPQEVEDQVSYPLTVNLQGLPGVKTVRSSSAFGFSMINIIFEDDIDVYFARTRVLERLNLAASFLPAGVVPTLGPDATGVGQVFWYTVDGPYDPGTLRSLQDWFIRYQLNSVPGVAEVASIGGFVRQYQIDVDPVKLRAFNVPMRTVFEAVQRSNNNVGAKVVEANNMEYVVRGLGLIESPKDIEDIVLSSMNGTPIYVRNVAAVQLGPEFRRGVLDKGGTDAVGGVVIIRYGANALDVINAVRAKIETMQSGLPKGVHINSFYDRSSLINHAVETLKSALIEEVILVTLAHVIFLWHFRSILIVTFPLPLAVLTAFLFMHYVGISSNIMSLGGIAIAIGVLVDAGIVMTENVIRHAENYAQEHGGEYRSKIDEITLNAARLVGRPIFFSMAIIILAFVPVFALTGMEGKLFHPLAFTKTFAMIGSTIIAVTLVPVLCTFLIRGRLHREENNPVGNTAVRLCPIPRDFNRFGIHAAPGRRDRDVDAGNRSQHLTLGGHGADAPTGSDHPSRSRCRQCGRKDRPRRNIHGSRADQYERNDCDIQTEGSMAGGINERRHPSASRHEAQDARRYKHLDPAHSEPYRHAIHRNPDTSRG
jgi:Cu(I)/Ag(I) efflux system membrane protein CusA/SilA